MFPARKTSWVLLPYWLFSIILTLEVAAESADQGRVLSQMIMVSDENDGPLMEQAKKYTDRNIPVILTKYGPIPYKPLPMSALDEPKDLQPMKKHPSGKGYYKSTITPVDIKTGEPLQPGRESLRTRWETTRQEQPQHGDRLQRLEDSFDFNNFPSQRIQRTAMQFESPLNQRNDPFRPENFNFFNSPFRSNEDFGKNYFKRESSRPSLPMDSRIVSDVRFGGSAAFGPDQEAALKLALDPRTVEQARQMAERPIYDNMGSQFMHQRPRPAISVTNHHNHHNQKKDKRHQQNSDSFTSSSEPHNANRNNRSHPPRQSSLHSVVRGTYGSRTASNIPLY